MDLEHRVQILEKELQILKGEMQSTLLEIHEYLLTNAHPTLRAKDAVPAKPELPPAPAPMQAPVVQRRPAAIAAVIHDDEEDDDGYGYANEEDVLNHGSIEETLINSPLVKKVKLNNVRVDDDDDEELAAAPRRTMTVPMSPSNVQTNGQVKATRVSTNGTNGTTHVNGYSTNGNGANGNGSNGNGSNGYRASTVQTDSSPMRSKATTTATVSRVAQSIAQARYEEPSESDSDTDWTALNRLAEWVGNKVKRSGLQNTRKVIEANAANGSFTPEIYDALLQLLALYDENGLLNSNRLTLVLETLSDESASDAVDDSHAHAHEESQHQKMILKLIAGVQNAGAGMTRRKNNG